jgi:hypothetical protein
MQAATVADDMAIVVPGPDLSMITMDLAPAPDMTLTCTMVGQPCTVGQGACQVTGKIVCSPSPACDATPGKADDNWHMAAAANGSWDWNCDGQVEYQYPTGDSAAPPHDTDPCASYAVGVICNQPHWYYKYFNPWPNPCGHPVTDHVCYWSSGNTCEDSPEQITNLGCK